jgi:hypothetical protein
MKKLIVLFVTMCTLACFLVPVNGNPARANSISKKIVLQKTGNYGYEVTIDFSSGPRKIVAASSPDGAVVSYTYSSAVDNAGVVTVTDFFIQFVPNGANTPVTYNATGDYF